MTMSDRICVQSKGQVKAILSPQNLLTCCVECATSPSGGGGCHGGRPENAWEYWIQEGIVTGGSFESNNGCQPYVFRPCTPEHNPCHEEENRPDSTPLCEEKCSNEYPISYEKDKYFGKESRRIGPDVTEIMSEIMHNGPVSAVMGIYDDFQNYTGGIYVRKSAELRFGHVVRLIGWGEENGTPYWIGANSWNDFWGEDGFFKILRGSDEVGIESGVMAADPDFNRSTSPTIPSTRNAKIDK